MVFEPNALFLLVLGVGLGLLVGAIPGFTATLAIALLLPFTFTLPPVEALWMLTGIYVGGIYGGSITAIVVRIPGAPANTMTVADGNAMAQSGRAEAALGLATVSSFIGGISGGVVLVLFAPQLARMALRFQSPETFSLILLALVTVSGVGVGSLSKGLAATVLGLMLSTVGLDNMLPVARFSMNVPELLVGVPLLVVVIGLFALSECFWQAGEPSSTNQRVVKTRGEYYRKIFDFVPVARKAGWKIYAKSAAIGAFIGALPGAGGAMSAFVSYAEAKRSSRHPERFGTGIPEGIIAPETANNAMTGGAFVPLLAFGIPGDAVTAVILGALTIQGITPGPQLMQNNAPLMQSLFVGYFVAYAVMLVVGLGLAPWFARLAVVQRRYILPAIGAVSVVAAYASERTLFAMALAIGVGAVGFALRRFGYPLVPVLLGLLLGAPLEANFRRALIVSEHGAWIFLLSPVSALLVVLSVATVLFFVYGHTRSFTTS